MNSFFLFHVFQKDRVMTNSKKWLFIFVLMNFVTTAYAQLTDGYGITITINEHTQKETWGISDPGIFVWIENGRWLYTDKMPACLVVIGESINADDLNKFVHGLEAITHRSDTLSPELFNGTWTFVDRDPFNSPFVDSYYEVRTQSNMTFGQLLQSVGGTKDSRVEIHFNRGCTDLNPRAFHPSTQHTTPAGFKTKLNDASSI